MYPYRFKLLKKRTVPTVKYYYYFTDLQRWHRRGKKHGDSGMILVERQAQILRYHSYGTIEKPCTTMKKVSIIHNPVYGPMPTDEERCIAPNFSQKENRLILHDISK